jgi:nitrate/TMAO reductase-like tetraheme cytochrome c subunit
LGGAVPNHITAGFPQDCSICHSTNNWTTSTFNHNATIFPLVGAHVTVNCALCHTGANGYSGNLPTTCVPCHQTDYNNTATLAGIPNHVASNYPTTCLNCHTMTNWLGALFNHSATRFGALTGAHATIACNLCHLSATPPPLDCYSCHTAAWQSTAKLGGQVPDHTAAGATLAGIVPSACGTCHTTTNWLGATFTHSWFNINHGNSGGVCTVCHISVATSGYSVFQCTVCHGNNNAANFNHPSVGGRYVYNSVACYQCHSRG